MWAGNLAAEECVRGSILATGWKSRGWVRRIHLRFPGGSQRACNQSDVEISSEGIAAAIGHSLSYKNLNQYRMIAKLDTMKT
jgi:hypothetical protein